MSLTPDVDVVIALHRPGTWIDACLESVVSQRDVAVQIILVDDDPSSPLAASLAAAIPNGVAITTGGNSRGSQLPTTPESQPGTLRSSSV